MAGQRAFNLLKDYVRSADTDSLIPPFNNEELRSILEDINVAFNENHIDAWVLLFNSIGNSAKIWFFQTGIPGNEG